ncbi:MAG: hypothetical protein QOG03_1976 [Actinomycetota bacterium]|jgi:hypothetical protein|nr:hypothetical protein [Actinomycetota bacterium]
MRTGQRSIGAVATAAIVLLVAGACGSSRRVATKAPPKTTTTLASAPSTTAAPGSATTVAPTGPTTRSTSSTSANLPLWPFRTSTEASDWQADYRSGGHQPWHLDAGETALSFAKGYLGYGEIDTVTGTTTNASGAHVGVGFVNPNGVKHTAAVVHLFKWGSGSDAPWEVAGTDDTDFSLTSPAYGATVHSPATVGGKITGVDENIKVFVRQISSSSAIGTFCCQPAGGDDSDWHATVSYSGATDSVLTIAASTGGHLKGVERFTVTGVRH